MEKQTPAGRLNYTGNLEPVVNRLCQAYQVSKATDFSVIEIGYEDCNVFIGTSEKKYVAKIFSKARSSEDITRYSDIMERVVGAGVNHPALLKTSEGGIVYTDDQADGISMVLMQFIEGKSFMDLGRTPDQQELQSVIEQASIVNSIDYHPPFIFDSWAIPNIYKMFEKVGRFVQADDLKLVKQVISQYEQIPTPKLPHAFVHGDFTKANVLKGDDGKIYILDFSVANWYPRIQELAVISANLMHNESNEGSLKNRCDLIAELYSKFAPLTQEERKYLHPYALAGVAMELMGAYQEKYINGNDTEETEFWLNLGRNGLRKELES
ncbi:MAG: phosphotransferase [Candidatus Daviesbacteria bacterium]|nr:phosphotransferase [Candidatus Daviesbacteria bacterium]